MPSRALLMRSSILCINAAIACLVTSIYAQLEPQYVPAASSESVTCYPADALAWRSIPGKIVLHGAPFVKTHHKKVPPAQPSEPIVTDPSGGGGAAVGIRPGGGVTPEPQPKPINGVKPPQPPVTAPPAQVAQPIVPFPGAAGPGVPGPQGGVPGGAGRPLPNMDPFRPPELKPAVRHLQTQEAAKAGGDQKVAGAVVGGVAIENGSGTAREEDDLDEEDKAAIARESMYASIQLKGLNWFGLDRINIFEGTNYKTIDQVMAFFVAHNINALRLPFSLAFALTPMDHEEAEAGGGQGELQYPDRGKISPEYIGLTSWEIIDLLFEKAKENGILILLDMHTLDPDKGVSRLWYDPAKYSEATVLWGWERILSRYVHHWNLFGLDIMNECHDHASWGKGDPMTDFNRYVERFILFVHERVPSYRGLFFVEGIFLNAMGRDQSPWPYWWGGNLFGADKYPIDVKIAALNDRIVYAPHIYGPDVSNMFYFNDWSFPNNLKNVWDNQFGWLIKSTRKALVVGEWGGSCNNKDGIVQEHLAQWMIDNCFQSNFWWALNPGSADTDGLMSQDWSHFDERKMALLGKVQPNPSKFTYEKATDMVCVRHGAPPNPQCADDLAHILKTPDTQQDQDNGYLRNAWPFRATGLRGPGN